VKLYGATMSWNVTRCVAALEEAGVEYELVPVDFGTGEHKGPSTSPGTPLVRCRLCRMVTCTSLVRYYLFEPFFISIIHKKPIKSHGWLIMLLPHLAFPDWLNWYLRSKRKTSVIWIITRIKFFYKDVMNKGKLCVVFSCHHIIRSIV